MFYNMRLILFIYQLFVTNIFGSTQSITAIPSVPSNISDTTKPVVWVKSTNCTLFSTSKEYWITFDDQNNTCYYISDQFETVTYHRANDICASKNATMASIHDSKMNYQLSHRDSGDYYSSTIYWIGLNSLTKRGEYKWSDNTPVNYNHFTNTTPLGEPIPSDILEQGRCVAMRSAKISQTDYHDIGNWFKDDCNDQHLYICERPTNKDIPTNPPPLPSGHCPSDWFEYPNEKCIQYINILVNFNEAKAKCKQLKAEMLSIHSDEENNFVTAITGANPKAYIGFYVKQEFSSWKWDDQTRVSYTNWGAQQSNDFYDNCAVIATDISQPGKWLRAQCSDNYSVICQKRKDPNIVKTGTANKCKITGFENFIQYRNSCYYVKDSPSSNFTSFFGAESNCQGMNGAHLLSIVDPFEEAFLKFYLKQYGKSDMYWIGLQSSFDSDTNISQIFEWTDQWPVYYTFWDNDQPQFAGLPRAECVATLRSNSTWRTTLCDNNFAYICKTTTNPLPKMSGDKSGVCPHLNNITTKSLLWIDIDRRSQYCYWFSVDSDSTSLSAMQSWSDSSFHCHRRNGTLVSIHSNHELMLLRNKMIETGNNYNTWIGLSKNINGEYVWEDGTALDFTNWDPNESIVKGFPDNMDDEYECVESTAKDLKWKSKPCNTFSRNYFICQTKKIYTNANVKHGSSTTKIAMVSTNNGPTNSMKNSTVNITTLMSTLTSDGTTGTTEPEVTTQNIKSGDGLKKSPSDKGLSKSAKAGITFGTVGGVVVIVAIIYFVMKRFRPNSPFVTKIENSLYLSKKNGSKAEPSVRWAKNNKNNI